MVRCLGPVGNSEHSQSAEGGGGALASNQQSRSGVDQRAPAGVCRPHKHVKRSVDVTPARCSLTATLVCSPLSDFSCPLRPWQFSNLCSDALVGSALDHLNKGWQGWRHEHSAF